MLFTRNLGHATLVKGDCGSPEWDKSKKQMFIAPWKFQGHTQALALDCRSPDFDSSLSPVCTWPAEAQVPLQAASRGNAV